MVVSYKFELEAFSSFQWLKSVVSLQTSIAQFLAKKQLERSSSQDGSRPTDSSKSEKPTASVQPVQNRDLADSAVMDTGKTDTKSKNSNNNSSSSDQPLPNGPLVGGDSAVNNGCLDLNKGAVSLLNASCSSVNGDIEMAEVGKSKSDSTSSQESSPHTNIVKVTWPSSTSDKLTSTVSSTSQSSNRNIVISTVNKTNNVYTRVVPGIPSKVQGQTSILSPRAGNQTGKLGSSVLKSNITSGSSSTTKVITVNQSQAGKNQT